MYVTLKSFIISIRAWILGRAFLEPKLKDIFVILSTKKIENEGIKGYRHLFYPFCLHEGTSCVAHAFPSNELTGHSIWGDIATSMKL